MSEMATEAPCGGFNMPFKSLMDFVLARITTVPSGMGVNVSLSLGPIAIDFLMLAGMVICPLLVIVASDI